MTALEKSVSAEPALGKVSHLPSVPWRDPHSVPPQELMQTIAGLEQACAQNPASPDLRTCLAMAHAMNYDVHRSFQSLDVARSLAPDNYWAQQKYAELLYRIRALAQAESEARRALELANSPLEIAVSRKLLAEIRQKLREGTQKPTWSRSLFAPAALLASLAGLAALLGMLR